jgi:hypothetical protein
MDKGILLGTKTLVLIIRHYIRETGGDITFPAFFIVVVLKIQNGLWFVFKTKLTLEIKRKHLKDILR